MTNTMRTPSSIATRPSKPTPSKVHDHRGADLQQHDAVKAICEKCRDTGIAGYSEFIAGTDFSYPMSICTCESGKALASLALAMAQDRIRGAR